MAYQLIEVIQDDLAKTFVYRDPNFSGSRLGFRFLARVLKSARSSPVKMKNSWKGGSKKAKTIGVL